MDVEMLVQTRIFGGFLQLVLPDDIRQIPKINPEIQAVPQIEPGKIPYTGLILDIRELAFEPVLYPVIISEQGDLIYSALFISREFAVQHGVCKYLCSMNNALQDPRVGSHPLVLKGLRIAGKDNTPWSSVQPMPNRLKKQQNDTCFLNNAGSFLSPKINCNIPTIKQNKDLP